MRERNYAARAMWPLVVMAAVFFLPTYTSCDGPPKSPAQFAADEPFMFAAVAPVFFAALTLALLTLRAVRRGEPDARTRRLGLLPLGLLSACTVGTGALMMAHHASDWVWLASAAAGSAVGAFVLRRARGLQPWRIWLHVLLAFAALAAVSMPSIFLGGDALHGSFGSFGCGAYLYLTALPAVALLAALGLRAGRRTAG